MARDEAQLLAMGQRIRELRDSHGLKQQTIADHCGVTLRTYQFWQEGKHPPRQDALEKLAELFEVTPQYILRGATPQLSDSHEVAERLGRIEAKIDELLVDREQADARLTAREHAELDRWRHLNELLEAQQSEQAPPRSSRARRSRRASDESAA